MKKIILIAFVLMIASSLYAKKFTCSRVGDVSDQMFRCSAGKKSIVYYIDKATWICFAGVDGFADSIALVDCNKLLQRKEIKDM